MVEGFVSTMRVDGSLSPPLPRLLSILRSELILSMITFQGTIY
jgi:hypothetical protein